MPYISAHEIITYEFGHFLYEVLEDIDTGSPMRASAFKPIKKEVPALKGGSEILSAANCKCGGLWLRKQNAIWQVHFPDGWRSMTA